MGPRPSTVTGVGLGVDVGVDLGVDVVMPAKLNVDINVKVKPFRGVTCGSANWPERRA
jgi:hypothetical protein